MDTHVCKIFCPLLTLILPIVIGCEQPHSAMSLDSEIEYLQRASRMYPDNPEIRIELVRQYLTKHAVLPFGWKDEAVKPLAVQQSSAIVRKWPNDPRGYLLRGLAKNGPGDYQAAISELRRAAALAPDWFEPHYWMEEVYRAWGNWRAGLKELDKAIGLLERQGGKSRTIVNDREQLVTDLTAYGVVIAWWFLHDRALTMMWLGRAIASGLSPFWRQEIFFSRWAYADLWGDITFQELARKAGVSEADCQRAIVRAKRYKASTRMPQVKRGRRLVLKVATPIEVRISWAEEISDAARGPEEITAMVPVGSVLLVEQDQGPHEAEVILRAVEYEALERLIIPEQIRLQPGYGGYFFLLLKADVYDWFQDEQTVGNRG